MEQNRGNASETGKTAGEAGGGKFGRAKEFVGEKYSAAADSVKEKYSAATDSVKEKYSTAADSVKEKYSGVKQKVADVDFGEMTGQVREYVRANPGKALLISVGVGFLIGMLLRRGKDED